MSDRIYPIPGEMERLAREATEYAFSLRPTEVQIAFGSAGAYSVHAAADGGTVEIGCYCHDYGDESWT